MCLQHATLLVCPGPLARPLLRVGSAQRIVPLQAQLAVFLLTLAILCLQLSKRICEIDAMALGIGGRTVVSGGDYRYPIGSPLSYLKLLVRHEVFRYLQDVVPCLISSNPWTEPVLYARRCHVVFFKT